MPPKLEPPPGHAPGALLARDTGPASRPVLLVAGCAVTGTVFVVGDLAWDAFAAPGLLVPVALLAALVLPSGLRAWRTGRAELVGARQPDTLAVDTHGVAARCDGRTPFRYAWSQVRRLDAGAGRESGWLRLWLVDGVPGPDALPGSRRTTEGALLVLRFGDGADRAAIGEAVRHYAPQGVRVRL